MNITEDALKRFQAFYNAEMSKVDDYYCIPDSSIEDFLKQDTAQTHLLKEPDNEFNMHQHWKGDDDKTKFDSKNIGGFSDY